MIDGYILSLIYCMSFQAFIAKYILGTTDSKMLVRNQVLNGHDVQKEIINAETPDCNIQHIDVIK